MLVEIIVDVKVKVCKGRLWEEVLGEVETLFLS